MKKYLFILGSLMMGLMMTSCSSDGEDNNGSGNTQDYVKVENATYSSEAMPAATTSTRLQATLSASTLQSGQASTIRIAKDRVYRRFFIGIKGKNGYWTYTPSVTRSDDDDDEWYEIPIEGGSSTGTNTIQISGEDENGDVTQPFETEVISRTDGGVGALVTSISYQGRDLYKMEYDNLGRLTKLLMQERSVASISYGSTLTIKDFEEDDITWTATLNVKGYVSSMKGKGEDYSDNVSFTYDDEGHLLRMSVQGNDAGDLFTSTLTQTWSDGNLVRCVSHTSDEDDGEDLNATLIYGDYQNKQHQFYYGLTIYDHVMSALYAGGLLGVTSDKLPIEIQQRENGYVESARYSYTFYDNGAIKTQTQTMNGYSAAVLTYSY